MVFFSLELSLWPRIGVPKFGRFDVLDSMVFVIQQATLQNELPS